MKSQPDLSIIVPIYNIAPWLPEFLDSLQLHKVDPEQVELILQDDASTDQSCEIAKTYAQNFPQIVTINQNEENLGPGESRNIALKSAVGLYVWFLDGDDLLEEGLLDSILTEIKQGKDLIYLSFYSFNKKKKWRKEMESEKIKLVSSLESRIHLNAQDRMSLLHYTVGPWLKIVKKNPSILSYPDSMLSIIKVILVEKNNSYMWNNFLNRYHNANESFS